MTTRILFYNWAQFDDHSGRGGGVSVYLKNLIDLLSQREDLEITFLSAGHEYSVARPWVHVRRTENIFGDRGVRSFTVMNSPVKAPAHDMFNDMQHWRRNMRIARVFRRFLQKEGPFDVVHFHNLEGISSSVLALRPTFPDTRFYYTWHNYIPLCAQVDLLFQGRRDCRDYFHGLKCVGCLDRHQTRADIVPFHRVGSTLERHGLSGKPLGNYLFGTASGSLQIWRATKFLWRDMMHGARNGFRGWRPRRPRPSGFAPIDPEEEGQPLTSTDVEAHRKNARLHREWRETNLRIFNEVLDGSFAVSRTVKDAIVPLGIKAEKVTVAPLGMDLHRPHAEMKAAFLAKPKRDGITFSFIGYANPSKGLPFMADALEMAQDESLRRNADLVVVARLDPMSHRRLLRLEECFRSVTYIPGYDRAQMPQLARRIDINIVPSIWRETYNQVGYELLCLGTPSILSSTVGLGMFYEDKDDFIFRMGDHADLVATMARFARDPARIARFWETPVRLPTMEDHAEQLLDGLLPHRASSVPTRKAS